VTFRFVAQHLNHCATAVPILRLVVTGNVKCRFADKIKRSLISNFRPVLSAIFFLLGYTPASEFDMPTFRNTVCSIFVGRVNKTYETGSESSETSAYKIRAPEYNQKERI